jgi:pimeloyl-ACP methyl ester carboxylesterase
MSSGDVSEEDLAEFVHNTGLVPAAIDPRTLPQWPVWLKHRQSLRMVGFAFGHEDSVDLLSAFDKPVLLVKGEGSSPSLHEITDILAEQLPRAQVVSYPGGHAPHIVSMQPFLERYRRFLSESNPAH